VPTVTNLKNLFLLLINNKSYFNLKNFFFGIEIKFILHTYLINIYFIVDKLNYNSISAVYYFSYSEGQFSIGLLAVSI
jgi:hypothetical protein